MSHNLRAKSASPAGAFGPAGDGDPVVFLPSAPPGGGVLVLTPTAFRHPELRALIAETYPCTRVVESKPIPVGKSVTRTLFR